ncbi:PREDICTED: uncharacterized protein LOC101296684 [Fragaria vesca subsp. vesca]
MAGTTSSSASNAMSETTAALIRNSSDMGWEFAELADATNVDKLKCKLCGKLVSGGIHRLKQHVANIKGNVTACRNSSDDQKARCKKAIEEGRIKKRQKYVHDLEVREEVIIEEDEDDSVSGGRKRRNLGPMDRYASAIDPDFSMHGSGKMRQ